jgi:hypothetical protein
MPIAQTFRVDPRSQDMSIKQEGSPKWVHINVSYKMFNTASATVNYDIAGNPRGMLILGAFGRNRTDWTGGTISNVTLSAGTTGSPAAWVAALTVFSGSPKTLPGSTIVPGTFVTTSASAAFRIQLVATTDTPDHLTQGSCDFYFLVSFVPLFA